MRTTTWKVIDDSANPDLKPRWTFHEHTCRSSAGGLATLDTSSNVGGNDSAHRMYLHWLLDLTKCE